ncbi:MAG: TonB family protein [Gammaproteobacteria bacterium]|jgi:periplasmic protein TonB
MIPTVTNSDSILNGMFGNSLLVALLLHGLVILTFNFDMLPSAPADIDQSLEITVVAPKTLVDAPEDADFLAQANQQGGGNTDEVVKPTVNEAMKGPVDLQTADQTSSEFSPAEEFDQLVKPDQPPRLAVRTVSTFSILEAAEEEETEQVPSPSQLLADLQQEIHRLEAEIDDKTVAYAQRPRRKAINASTKEHIYAAYMESWRRKIERVGNLNYPRGQMGDVVVHIAVRQDGSIERMRILRHADSSLINESALKIATLAAPFPPFPEEIRQKTDILDIIRTWRFLEETKQIEVD